MKKSYYNPEKNPAPVNPTEPNIVTYIKKA